MQKTNFKTRLLALLTAVFMVVMCVPFAAFAEVEGLKKIVVSFYTDGGVEAAYGYSLEPNQDNMIPNAFKTESGLDDSKLDHWTYENGKADFAPSAIVTYADLAKLVTATDSEGVGYINLAPVFKTEKPATLQKIIVSFNDAAGKEMAAGYTLTAGDVNSIAGDVYATVCPEGKELDYWTYAGKTFAKGSDVSFEKLAAIIGTDFTSEGEAYVNFVPEFKDKAVEPTPVTLKKIVVAFKDAAGKEMAAGYTLTAENNLNSIAGDVYADACPAGKELDYWTFSGKKFAKGADVTFEQLAAIIGTNYTDEGVSYVTFVPEFKDKAVEPTPVTLKKIVVSFNDANGKEMAAGYTLTAENNLNSIAGDVYADACPAGKELDYWTFSGKKFAKGADVTFEQLAAIIGTNYTDEGVSYVTFVPEFKDKAVEPTPVTLKKIVVSFNDANGKEMAAGYTLTAENNLNSIAGDVYADACPAGKELDYWTFSGKTFAKGADVTFEQLAAIIGDNYTAEGVSYVNFVPEFKNVAASLTKIKMIFTKADGATSVFATGELTAESEWYVLPDAAGVINLADGEKLTGWTLFQNGAKYAAGEKVTFESLKELAGKNVDNDGVAYLNFYADLKTDVELKNITIKYVEDKDGAQEDVAAPQNNFTAKDEFTILTDNLYDGKVPAGKKLIGWQYKNGGNTTNFVKGEHVKFDTLKALLNGNWDNEGNAWVTLTPVFQDVKSNNSSSSSSSSSSNKTTTASNEKQVVKAAAAPANTTKVLPKTGASNVAPLLGGSLAVVALLMGYGVYSLVLRKKD